MRAFLLNAVQPNGNYIINNQTKMKTVSLPTKSMQDILSKVKKLDSRMDQKKQPIFENIKLEVAPELITVVKANITHRYSVSMQTRNNTDLFDILLPPDIAKHILESNAHQCTLTLNTYKEMHIDELVDVYEVKVTLDDEAFIFFSPDPTKFPKNVKEIGTTNATFTLSIDAKDLYTVLPFSANDDLRPNMASIYFEFGETKYNMVATDGHRLVMKEKDKIKNDAFNFMWQRETFKFLFIKKSVKNMFAGMVQVDNYSNWEYIEEKDKHGRPKLVKTEIKYTGISYVYDGLLMEVISLTPSRPFPDYKVVLPIRHDMTATMHKHDLQESIKTILPAANRSTHQILFHFNGRCELSAQDIDYETEAKTSLNSDNVFWNNDTTLDIAFQGNMLLEMLKFFQSTMVTFKMSGPTKAMSIEQPGMYGLQMPLMLN